MFFKLNELAWILVVFKMNPKKYVYSETATETA